MLCRFGTREPGWPAAGLSAARLDDVLADARTGHSGRRYCCRRRHRAIGYRKGVRDDLTAQELQIAQFARDGLSNTEIGLACLSAPSTVEYHLHKVFTELEIATREHLDRVLPAKSPEPTQDTKDPAP